VVGNEFSHGFNVRGSPPYLLSPMTPDGLTLDANTGDHGSPHSWNLYFTIRVNDRVLTTVLDLFRLDDNVPTLPDLRLPIAATSDPGRQPQFSNFSLASPFHRGTFRTIGIGPVFRFCGGDSTIPVPSGGRSATSHYRTGDTGAGFRATGLRTGPVAEPADLPFSGRHPISK